MAAAHGPDSTLEYAPPSAMAARGLAALRHRDFRLFWLGQLVSLIGTWMQIVAQSWLVLILTDSPLALGLLSALQFTPILALSLLGGVVADRLPRRKLLLGTQAAAMCLALALAILTSTGLVQYGHVLVLAALLGVVNAVDMPTRQAFVVELVGPDDLNNSIALNSAAFNSARLIGPAVAGLAIGWIGVAGCFYLNAASFVAALLSLLAVHAGNQRPTQRAEPGSVWEDLREGLGYAMGHPRVRLVVGLIAAVATFGMNMGVLIPLLARNVLHVDAAGFGFLTSAMGLGSLVAALSLAFIGPTPRIRMLLCAAAAMGLLEVALALTQEFWLAALILGGLGFAMVFLTTLANTVLQTSTPDELRGRVMSLYTTVFAGTAPIGSLFAGALAEGRGVALPLALGGAISLVAAFVGYLGWMAGRDKA